MSGDINSSDRILKGIIKNDKRVIENIYQSSFEIVRNFVLANKGGYEDAEDIFQEALIIVYKKLIVDELKLTCSLKTYLFSICKRIWYKKLREDKKFVIDHNCSEIIGNPFEPDKSNVEQKKFNLYQKHFFKLSDACQKILRLFLKKTPLKEVTKIMGFNSDDYTKTRKYLCKQKLKERVLSDPDCIRYQI
jgi:RNA polymerase sigma factor (sigma-70 family)